MTMRQGFKRWLAVAALLAAAIPAAAEPAYTTYTYSYQDNERLLSPAAMQPAAVYHGAEMGTEALSGPRDIVAAPDGLLYIADTGNSRILCLDNDYRLKREYLSFVQADGATDTFNKPEGIFVTESGELYIADTGNSRIVVLQAEDGSLLRVLGRPETELLDWNAYTYEPVALTVDKAGRLSVVSRSVYQGILSLEKDGQFAGFLGAKKVSPDLVELLWRKFMTEEQLKRVEKFMPSEYNNLAMDSKGFLFATTNSITPTDLVRYMSGQDNDSAPIKRLNPTGIDVLKRNGWIPPGGDAKIDTDDKGVPLPSNIVDVAPGPDGTYSLLDARTNAAPAQNKIFTYDSNGNLLYAFGGMGEQEGLFAGAAALCYRGEELLVLDEAGALTRFTLTAYGEALYSAIRLTEERQYDAAVKQWKEVLRRNNNLEMANDEIGKIHLRQGNYEEAMENFRRSNNRTGYSQAYAEVRREQIRHHVGWLILGVAIGITLLILFFRKSAAVNKKGAGAKDRWTVVRQVNYGFYAMVHPFAGSWNLVHEGRGGTVSATAVLVLSVFARLLYASSAGFIVSQNVDGHFDLFKNLFSILAPFVLWVVANWCMTTLMDGKGTMGAIYRVSAYAMFPYILAYIPLTAVSHFITQQEMGLLSMILQIVGFWVLLLLFLNMLTIHQFSLPKGTLAAVLSLLGMAIILFLGMLFLMLISKMMGGFSNIFREIQFMMG